MIANSLAESAGDATLLAESRAGAVDAFRQIVERYQNLVCAVAYAATGDRVLSEDVAQETFLVAWSRLATLREPERFGAWLCGIARNLGRKAVRRGRRERVADVSEVESRADGILGPLDAMLDREAEAAVWKALERLPPRYREPLVLFYREERSVAEVARGLGLSEEAAKQRLSRGRRSLAEGVGELVERTVTASRPRKGFSAAVVALLAASASGIATASSSGVSAAAARGPSASSAWKLAGALAGLGALAALGVAVVAARSEEVPTAAVRRADDPRAVLAELRRARAARLATTGGDPPCELRGTVKGPDGRPVRALVAVMDQTAAALDPTVVATDDRGAWRLGPQPSGEYVLSVTAPGHRAETRIVRCAAGDAGGEQHVSVASGGTPLSGMVSDIGGGPVAEVTVWVLGEGVPADGRVFATRTGVDGAYAIQLPDGLYTAVTVHPEYVVDVRPVSIADNPAREDFSLVPGGSIEGTVMDAGRGRPIASAEVSTVAPHAHTDVQPRWLLAATYGAMFPVRTDQQGRFRMRGLPPGDTLLSVRSPELATADPTAVPLTLAEQKTGVVLEPAAAGAISGFVVRRGDERRPVDGAHVIALEAGAAIVSPIRATTDGSGHFALTGVGPGRYRLVAFGPSSAPMVLEREVSVTDQDPEELLLAVERGVAVRGRVQGGRRVSVRLAPATGAVDAFAASLVASLTLAEVDEDGGFVFPAVAPGEYVIEAFDHARRGRLPITVSGAELGGLAIEPEPRPGIAGQVLLDTGAPLAGAVVAAQPIGPTRRAFGLHNASRTDENGRFRIMGVEAGRHEVRVFDGRGQRPWRGGAGESGFAPRLLEVPRAGVATTRLEVASGGTRMAGRVLGPDGAPVADAWIQVVARDADRAPALFESAPILSDAAGRFSIDGLFGDQFELSATGPEGHHRAALRRVAPGRDRVLELRPTATLVGKVSFGGKPVPDFRVTVRQAGGELASIGRGVEGEFRVADLVADDVEIEIGSPLGYAVRAVALAPGSTPVDLELTRWASIRGRLIGRDGRPLSGAAIMMQGGRRLLELTAGGSRLDERTGADGSFALQHLTAGRRELWITDPPFRLEFDLQEGQDLDLGVVETRLAPDQTTQSASEDLGLRFFLGSQPPSRAQLAAIDREPPLAYRDRRDPRAQLWIAAVTAGSPAHAAGIEAGDRVVAVGQRTVGTGESVAAAMMSLSGRWRSRGRKVVWRVVRGDRELALGVTVPEGELARGTRPVRAGRSSTRSR